MFIETHAVAMAKPAIKKKNLDMMLLLF